MSNLTELYRNPDPKEKGTIGVEYGKTIPDEVIDQYLVSYHLDDNLIIITRRDDWEQRNQITLDNQYEDIRDILHELGLVRLEDSVYELTGSIRTIEEMIGELYRRGFWMNSSLDIYVNEGDLH